MSEKKSKAILNTPAKPWYLSKVMWVNAIAMVAAIVQIATGEEWLDPGAQLAILGFVNVALRLITGTAILW